MAKRKSINIEEISWRDHYATGGWKYLSEVNTEDEGVLVHSVGFVIFENDHCVKLAKSICMENGTIAHETTILKSTIQTRRIICGKTLIPGSLLTAITEINEE